MKYTKGPWQVRIVKDLQSWTYRVEGGNINVAGYGSHICTINSFLEAQGFENAKIISATPLLYEACKAALAVTPEDNPLFKQLQEAVNAVNKPPLINYIKPLKGE